jgi:leader peptidase (prepilin peptidase)/N-methyltransferase
MTLIELFSSSPAWFISSVMLLSLLIGSFLNVVIHRFPIMLDREWRKQSEELLTSQSTFTPTLGRSDFSPTSGSGADQAKDVGLKSDLQGRSEPSALSPQPSAHIRYNLIVPRSACPSCGTQITALQNIPVLSWLWLKGKCARCGARISSRYPLVEVSTAVLSGLVAWKFGFTYHAAAALVFTWTLIALCMIDFDHQILPDDLTLPLLWLGLLLSLFSSRVLPVTPHDAIIGAIAGYISLWLVFHLFKLATGKEGMGYGDFKLFAAIGAWLGWQMLPLVILLSALTGAVIGILLIVVRGRDRNIPIPFGPYLAAAGWIALMWGEQIVGAYLGLLGVGAAS